MDVPKLKKSNVNRLQYYTKQTAFMLGAIIGSTNGFAFGLTLAFALSGITGGLSFLAIPLFVIIGTALGGSIVAFITRDKHKKEEIKQSTGSSHFLLKKEGIKPKPDLKQVNHKQPAPLQNHNIVPIANITQCIPSHILNNLLITIKKYKKGYSSSIFNANIPKDVLVTKDIESGLIEQPRQQVKR